MAELKKSYESMLVVSTKGGDEGITALVDKFKALIEANAELENVDVWGKRRLDRQRRGRLLRAVHVLLQS